MTNFVGSKYEVNRDLDIRDIAKLVRADIKASVKEGALPKGKYAVRIEHYSMGQSLHVELSGTGKTWCLPELCAAYSRNAAAYADGFVPEFHEVVAKLEEIANAYNYDRSDSQTDYFDSNFHLHVEILDARAERNRLYEEANAQEAAWHKWFSKASAIAVSDAGLNADDAKIRAALRAAWADGKSPDDAVAGVAQEVA